MARGDKVRILVDVGTSVMSFEVVADHAGRSVEVVAARGGMLEVRLIGRTGKVVKTDRFMGSRVIALIEDRVEPEEEPPVVRELFGVDRTDNAHATKLLIDARDETTTGGPDNAEPF
jgi:hypothetical protein